MTETVYISSSPVYAGPVSFGSISAPTITASGSLTAYGSNTIVRWSTNNVTAFPQNAGTKYYKIATLGTTGDLNNGGRIRITGTIGGYTNSTTTGIDGYINSREALAWGGTLTGYGGDGTAYSDIVIYLEADGTFSVYIVRNTYYQFDLLVWGETAGTYTNKILPCPTTDTSITTPTGTLQSTTLTNACKTLVATAVAAGVGNLGIGKVPTTTLDVNGTVAATTLTGAGSGITALNMANAGSGTLAVSRGGTGVTTSTGTGNNVLSAGPTLTGTTTVATLNATGDITAFSSDDRLKTKTGTLTDALDKVCTLDTFTYTHNDIARSFGFTDKRQYVGISAQQVQKVLPETIRRAPFDSDTNDGVEKSKSGQDYLTVQYERIVPLLIEALKEERKAREALEQRIKLLEQK